MARRFAQFPVAMWTNPEYNTLDREDQHALFMLQSQAKLSLCGVLDFIPGRLILTASNWSTDELRESLRRLEEHPNKWIVFDQSTQEILIRRFVRDDQVLQAPNVAQGMAVQFGEIMSEKLQDTLVEELVSIYVENPSANGWKGVRRGNPVLMDKVLSRTPQTTLSEPF